MYSVFYFGNVFFFFKFDYVSDIFIRFPKEMRKKESLFPPLTIKIRRETRRGDFFFNIPDVLYYNPFVQFFFFLENLKNTTRFTGVFFFFLMMKCVLIS